MLFSQSYLQTGGFPEYLIMSDEIARREYFWSTVIERVVYHDVPAIEEIRDVRRQDEVLQRAVAEPGYRWRTLSEMDKLGYILNEPRLAWQEQIGAGLRDSDAERLSYYLQLMRRGQIGITPWGAGLGDSEWTVPGPGQGKDENILSSSPTDVASDEELPTDASE